MRLSIRTIAIVPALFLALALAAGCGQSPAAPTATTAPAPTKAAAPEPTKPAAQPQPTQAAAAPTSAPTAAPAAAPTKAAAQPKMGGTLLNVQPGDGVLGHYDANVYAERTAGMWWGPVYESLLAHDLDTYEIKPQLVTKWEISPDGKTITLSVRQGVKWHNVPPVNGREFTSADVKWNLERVRDLKVPSAWTSAAKSVTNVETPDKYTAKVILSEPNAGFIPNIAEASWMMYPHELFEAYGEKQNKAAIGTGPFMFKSYEPKSSIRFVRNPDYWDKPMPYLDEAGILIMTDHTAAVAALRTGQVAYFESIPLNEKDTILKTNPELKAYQHLANAYGMWLNAKKKPFDDPRVRRAIHLALDRQEMIQLALGGSGLLQGLVRADAVPLGITRTPEELQKVPGYRQPKDADIAEAKKLLADAGYASGLQFTQLTYVPIPDMQREAEVAKEQLKKIGVDMTIKPTEFGVMLAATSSSGDYEAAVAWLPGGDADQWYARLHSKGPVNASGHSTPEMDKLLEQGRVESDPAKRVQIYRQWEDLNFQAPFIVPLYNVQAYYLARPEFVNLKPMKSTNTAFYTVTWKYVWVNK